jgi:hypothetical protein
MGTCLFCRLQISLWPAMTPGTWRREASKVKATQKWTIDF